MRSSIHISKYAIKVIAYTKVGSNISVNAYHTYPLPEECIMNGVIIDAAPINEGLHTLKASFPQAFKNVSLVLDGSFVYTKRITVPGKLNARMYDRVVRDEFSEVSSDVENLICDHFPLNTNADGSKQVLACGVENAHVQAYLSIFNAAEIKLSSVHLGVQALFSFIKMRPELSTVPFVLNVVDDVVMLSMIFQNGVNVFQSRSRLYGDDRSSLVRSTLDGLSGIIQFNKSQNFADLTHCYYLGLSNSEMDFFRFNNDYPEISFSTLDVYRGAGTERLPPDAHLAYLGALIPDSEPDLLHSIKMLEKVKKDERPKNRFIPIAVCLALILAGALTFMGIQMRNVEREVSDINSYLNDPVTVEKREAIDAMLTDTYRMNDLYNAVADKKASDAQQPKLSRHLVDTIVGTGAWTVRVTGLDFKADAAVVTVVATCSERESANFVEMLKKNPCIETVRYRGYGTNAAGDYVFTLDIIATGWGKEE